MSTLFFFFFVNTSIDINWPIYINNTGKITKSNHNQIKKRTHYLLKPTYRKNKIVLQKYKCYSTGKTSDNREYNISI